MGVKTMATPIGVVPKHKIDFRLMRNAGFTWKPEVKDFTIISEEIEHLQLNKKGVLEKEMGWLPVRYYNFLYALSKCGNNLDKAMDYSEENLFGLDGRPVYLPDEIAKLDGWDEQRSKTPTSYNKILKEIDEKKMDQF